MKCHRRASCFAVEPAADFYFSCQFPTSNNQSFLIADDQFFIASHCKFFLGYTCCFSFGIFAIVQLTMVVEFFSYARCQARSYEGSQVLHRLHFLEHLVRVEEFKTQVIHHTQGKDWE